RLQRHAVQSRRDGQAATRLCQADPGDHRQFPKQQRFSLSRRQEVSRRYKDLRIAAVLQREFPYEVEAATPEMGFRQRLNLIESWVTERLWRTDYGRWGRRRDMRDYAVWAFRDAETA